MVTHFSAAAWREYVHGELSDARRDEMERHLYGCEQCLEQFIRSVEEWEAELPGLPAPHQLTQRVMQRIAPSRSRFWDHVLIRYTVAASLTLLLLASGVFQDLLDGSAQLAQWTATETGVSLTDTLMAKIVSLLETFSRVQDVN